MSRVVHTNIWSAYGYARKAGYEGTEEEFEQGLKKSAEAAGNAEESASTASEAATEAKAARDAAAQSAESASTSEGNALEYANSAAQVLRDAQAVAQTVNAKANEAAGSASRAENYAQTATTKASEATTAAGTATAAATSASGSAQEADASATAAAASETNAAASETNASNSAASASESAGVAAQSAQAAQDVLNSIPADYSQLNADVTDLKSQINLTDGDVFNITDAIAEDATASGWRLETTGLCTSNASYKLVKFKVTSGDIVKITSPDMWQFQTAASVPSSGTSNRVGNTYGSGTYYVVVPSTATYLIISALTTDTPTVYAVKSNNDRVSVIANQVNEQLFTDRFVPTLGTTINYYGIGTNGIRYGNNAKRIRRYDLEANVFDYLHIVLKSYDDTYVFQDSTDLPGADSSSTHIVGTPYRGICNKVVKIPSGAVCVFITETISDPDDLYYTTANVTVLFDDASFDPYYFMQFEYGTLDISSSGWTKSNYNASKRIRINPKNPLKLFKGDIIKFTRDNIYFAVGYYANNTYSDSTGWITGEYTCPADGEYVLTARFIVEQDLTDTYDLSKYCRICRAKSPVYNDLLQLQDGNDRLPDYYTDAWISSRMSEVREKSEIVNGAVFTFVTDLHFASNSGYSKYLIRDILDQTTVPICICGGDFKGVDSASIEEERTVEFMEVVGKERCFAIRGNHDYSGDTWRSTYGYIYRNSERYSANGLPYNGCYCLDNHPQKTRYLLLNSQDIASAHGLDYTDAYGRISTEQLAWVKDRILELDGWNVIVISHIPSDSALNSYDSSQASLQTLLEAFANHTGDYASTTCTLICHITGHSHRDESHVSNGVLSITTTCDAYYPDDGHGAAQGTVTEQAFDVYCIDYDTNKINAVRVGRGASREWTKANGTWTQTV